MSLVLLSFSFFSQQYQQSTTTYWRYISSHESQLSLGIFIFESKELELSIASAPRTRSQKKKDKNPADRVSRAQQNTMASSSVASPPSVTGDSGMGQYYTSKISGLSTVSFIINGIVFYVFASSYWSRNARQGGFFD
eukprot:scaffold98018_cov48-Attheya_sp.AAC.4